TQGKASRLAALRHQQGRRNRSAARRVPVAGDGSRAASGFAEERVAGAEGRRRHAAPDPGAGDTVEPVAAALHAGGAEAAAALSRGAVSAPRRPAVPQSRAVLRSREQVPADHQRQRHFDRRQAAAGPELDHRRDADRDDVRAAGRRRPGRARRAAGTVMAMTVTPSRGNPCSVGVGSWTLGIVIAAVLVSPAAAQVPNAAAAIDAARDAKAKTEAAQKKNAEALDPPQPAAGPPPPHGAG